jgi:hypothetical protein
MKKERFSLMKKPFKTLTKTDTIKQNQENITPFDLKKSYLNNTEEC